MTKEETLKILTVLKSAYPTFYRDSNSEELSGVINLWYQHLSDLDYERVEKAVSYYISTEKFAPSIAGIRETIYKMFADNRLSTSEAWKLVCKAVRNSTYNSIEEFEKLPQKVQKVIGSSARLRALALEDETYLNGVTYRQFKSDYESETEREKENASLPESVKLYIKTNQVAQIESGEK